MTTIGEVNPKITITPQLQSAWFALMNESQTVQDILQILEDSCPDGYKPGKQNQMESVALSSAHAQGWRDCMQKMKDIAMNRIEEVQSEFMDMTESQR
jgi:hypothetical protein